MRKPGSERCRRPAMMALMLATWSELPLSVHAGEFYCYIGRSVQVSYLRTTTFAFEAASEMMSELS